MKTANLCKRWMLLLAITQLIGQLIAEERAPEVKLRPVKVRVVDESGVPVIGVRIHRSVWTDAKFPPNADFNTDDRGETTFEVPEQVSILRLWASKQNHVPMFANFDAREMGGDPVPKDYTFTLYRGTVIGGFIRDELGTLIPGAKVEVSINSRDSSGTGIAVVSHWLAEGNDGCISDKNGFWSLHNVPPGSDWEISLRLQHAEHVSDQDWRSLRKGSLYTLAQLRDQTAETVMESGVRVTGTITGPDGQPVPKALVIWGDKPYHNTNQQEVWADAKGHYKLPPLVAGPTMLTVVAEGFAPELKLVELATRDQVENVSLRAGKTVTFRFLDAAGNPIPQVRVNITRWRDKESLFNWRHSNVPYSKIPDQADDQGIYSWTWAPDDEVEYLFGKNGYEMNRDLQFGPGTHELILQEQAAP